MDYQEANGSWKPFANQWKSENGKLSNIVGPAQVDLASNADGDVARMRGNNKLDMSFSLRDAAKGKSAKLEKVRDLENGRVTYSDVLPATDLRLQLFGSSVKDVLVLKDKSAVRQQWIFDWKAPGLRPVTKPDGSIVFQDKKNIDVLRVPQGSMIDSLRGNDAVPVKTTVGADGHSIVMTPDPKYFENAVFPVFVDPTWEVANGSINEDWADAYTSSANPSANYNNTNQFNGDCYENRVGYSPYPNSEFYTYFKQRADVLNGKQILDGKVIVHAYAHNNTAAMNVWPVAQAWTGSGVTWNARPNHYAVSAKTAIPAADGDTGIAITDWVENWANGTWQNFGLSFDTGGAAGYYALSATENSLLSGYGTPLHLRVTYNDRPSPGQLTSPNENDLMMTTTPTFAGTTGTDPNGDSLRYMFRVSNTDNPEQGQIINSQWLATPSWTVPEGSLQDGNNYSVYMATDDYHIASWSLIRSFRVNLRLGEQEASPTDSMGPFKINLANGNVNFGMQSRTMKTLGGDAGVSFAYNSRQPSMQGLQARYFSNCGDQPSDVPPTQNAEPTIVRNELGVDFN